jgi:opacity protein-like surface antigen
LWPDSSPGAGRCVLQGIAPHTDNPATAISPKWTVQPGATGITEAFFHCDPFKEFFMHKNRHSLSALALVTLAMTLGSSASAQTTPAPASASGTTWYTPIGGRYVGIDIGSAKYNSGGCGVGGLACEDRSDAYSVYAGGMWNRNFGLEIGATDFGSVDRAGGKAKAYGFSLKAVGVAPLTESLAAFAKVGTLYSHTKVTADAGAGVNTGNDSSWGLTYGVGLSFDFSPKVAAVLGWDRSNVHFAGSQEHINTTSLGLKYRF